VINLVTAYALLKTEMDSIGIILRQISKVEGVNEVQGLHGAYDIIAKIKAESMNEVKNIVNQVRNVNNGSSTLMMIVNENIL
jgi:DNA-binding Lrp family transcriptional regulator